MPNKGSQSLLRLCHTLGEDTKSAASQHPDQMSALLLTRPREALVLE